LGSLDAEQTQRLANTRSAVRRRPGTDQKYIRILSVDCCSLRSLAIDEPIVQVWLQDLALSLAQDIAILIDYHLALPRITKTKEILREELVPFH